MTSSTGSKNRQIKIISRDECNAIEERLEERVASKPGPRQGERDAMRTGFSSQMKQAELINGTNDNRDN